MKIVQILIKRTDYIDKITKSLVYKVWIVGFIFTPEIKYLIKFKYGTPILYLSKIKYSEFESSSWGGVLTGFNIQLCLV
jgi:hypothetical protein